MKRAAAEDAFVAPKDELDPELGPEPTLCEVERPAAPSPVHLEVVQSGRTEPLSKCVEEAIGAYLRTTDGHEAGDLHRFVLSEVERPLFRTVMRHTDGNLSRAAKILGLTRSTLRKRLAEYGIER